MIAPTTRPDSPSADGSSVDPDPGPSFEERWRESDVDADELRRLSDSLGVDPWVARLLWNRDIRELEQARRFLCPSLAGLADPAEIPDMDRAVTRIRAAIDAGERICIYGDYDVDGLTATTLLVELFRHLGVDADTYVPDRLREGYGLNVEAIRRIYARGAQLVITVDGGSNDVEEIRLATELGMDVIVTDHHPIHGELLDVPIVHPGRPDRPSPSAGLAGVGVAYKLVWALGREFSGEKQVDESYRDFMLASLMYVALGTVADVVPLTGENRILVHYGLRSFGATDHAGIRALLAEGKVTADSVAAENIAFRLAPLINAAGRLGAADRALELLLSHDDAESSQLASWLGDANRERKEIENGMLEASLAQIEELEPDGPAVGGRGLDSKPGRPIVVAGDGWHSGVAGIVAARLVERFRRPVFVIAVKDGLGRGSARSLDGFPLQGFYEAARPLTESIGGHALAGGLSVKPERIGALREALVDATDFGSEVSTAAYYDGVLDVESITPELMRGLAQLEPHGHGNPTPCFRFDDLRIEGDVRLVGRTEEHVTFLARQGRRRIRAIYFRGAERVRELTSVRNRVSVVAELYLNDFRGTARPELRILDFGPSPDRSPTH